VSAAGWDGGREHYSLGQPVAATDLDRRIREIQQLNFHFVLGAAIVGVDHANAVGHHQAPPERRAAAREYPKKVPVRHANHEPGPDEADAAWGDFDVHRRGQIKPGRTRRCGFRETNRRIETFNL
jgi:hypothetical protein